MSLYYYQKQNSVILMKKNNFNYISKKPTSNFTNNHSNGPIITHYSPTNQHHFQYKNNVQALSPIQYKTENIKFDNGQILKSCKFLKEKNTNNDFFNLKNEKYYPLTPITHLRRYTQKKLITSSDDDKQVNLRNQRLTKQTKQNVSTRFQCFQGFLREKQLQKNINNTEKVRQRYQSQKIPSQSKPDQFAAFKQKMDNLQNNLLKQIGKSKAKLTQSKDKQFKNYDFFKSTGYKTPKRSQIFLSIKAKQKQDSELCPLFTDSIVVSPQQSNKIIYSPLSANKKSYTEQSQPKIQSPTKKLKLITDYMGNTQQQIQSCKAYASYILQQAKKDIKNIQDLPILQTKINQMTDNDLKFKCHYVKKQNKKDLGERLLKIQPKNSKYHQRILSQSTFVKEKAKKHYYVSKIINSFMRKEPSAFDILCQSHFLQSKQILNSFIFQPSNEIKIARPLPPTNKKTLVFDLDQTLVHCQKSINQSSQIEISILLPNNCFIKSGFNVRPYSLECLYQLKKDFELMVFTASHQCYANAIIDKILDPKGQIFSERYFRQDCVETPNGIFIKDLRVIDRNLSQILLIDNCPYSYVLQISNGVPIIPFTHDKEDSQLMSLTKYLKQFVNTEDVRLKNADYFQFSRYSQKFPNLRTMLHQLYQ